MSRLIDGNVLDIIFFDVGLGDCIFASCGEKTLLVDGGNWYVESLKKYLKDNCINRIDYIVCTHAHEDHADGLAEILSDIEFGEVFCNIKSFPKSESFTKITELVQLSGKSICVPGIHEKRELGNATIEFLGPEDIKKYKNGNDCSLLLRLSLGSRVILLMADAMIDAISDLYMRENDLKTDIVKIPHHGLNIIREDFLDKINAQIAVISYGENTYGKISEELLSSLIRRNIQIWRTDLCGDIHCQIHNNNVFVQKRIKDSDIKNKKLLILGANAESLAIVKRAQEMGIYTIVTDHIINSPAKKVADEYLDIDGKDIEKLASIISDKKIDGILVGVADPLVPYYVKLCKKVQLPCYVQDINLNFFTDKKYFKNKCKEEKIPIIKQFYAGSNFEEVEERELIFPLIVKPSVSRGGKGVFLCNNLFELKTYFENAKLFSDSTEVLIEEYMNCEDVMVSYIFYNGTPRLLSISDRQVIKKPGCISPVTYGSLYPSKWTNLFLEKYNHVFYELFKRLKIKNGIFSMQMFVKNDEFYPYDPDCIINGELSSSIYPKAFKIDVIEACIRYALTGNMDIHILNDCIEEKAEHTIAASIWILLKPGTIKTIKGREILEKYPEILGYIWRLKEGDVITDNMFQTEKSTLARIWISAKSIEELKFCIKDIRKAIQVYDISGNDMVYQQVEE